MHGPLSFVSTIPLSKLSLSLHKQLCVGAYCLIELTFLLVGDYLVPCCVLPRVLVLIRVVVGQQQQTWSINPNYGNIAAYQTCQWGWLCLCCLQFSGIHCPTVPSLFLFLDLNFILKGLHNPAQPLYWCECTILLASF